MADRSTLVSGASSGVGLTIADLGRRNLSVVLDRPRPRVVNADVAARKSRRTLPARLAYALVAAVIGLGLFASVTPSPLYHTYSALWHFSPLTLTLTLIYATYAFGVLAVAAATDSSTIYLAGSILGGIGFGVAFLGGLRALVAAIPHEHRAAVMSAFYVVAYTSLSVPAVLAGVFVSHLGLRSTFETFGSVVAGSR